MDVFDRATETEELFRSQAIAAQAQKAPKVGDWEVISAKWCVGPPSGISFGAPCGERIPDERRRAIPGVDLCAECQTEKEKRERQRR